MNKRLSITLSISIHLVLVLFMIILNPELKTEKEDETKISIELITKKEEKTSGKGKSFGDNVDILDSGTSSLSKNMAKPSKNNYLEFIDEPIPELYISSSNSDSSENSEARVTNIDNFENSLEELFSFEENILEEPKEDDFSISWEGDSRDSRTNTGIDFTKFPSESFTGVGVTVEFMVNPVGEVYGVKILPPGSGSVEFDILIKQYVTNFLFKPGEHSSKGELFIVYN